MTSIQNKNSHTKSTSASSLEASSGTAEKVTRLTPVAKEFIPVHGLWVIRGNDMIGESQVGSPSANEHHRKFVKVFMDQVILPAKPDQIDNNETPSFSIYVKKRQFLFHILYIDNEYITLSMTKNTTHQSPVDAVFDLLNAIRDAFNNQKTNGFSNSLGNALGDLHHEYQLRARPKVSLNFDDNPLFLSDEDIANDANDLMDRRLEYNDFGQFFSDSDVDDDANLEFCYGYDLGSEPSDDTARDHLSLRYARDSGHNTYNTSGTGGTGSNRWGSQLNLPSPSVTQTIGNYSSDYHQIFHAQQSSSWQPTPSNSPRGSALGSESLRPQLSDSNTRDGLHSINLSGTETVSDSVGLFDIMDLMEQKERDHILVEEEEVERTLESALNTLNAINTMKHLDGTEDDEKSNDEEDSQKIGCLPYFILKSGWMTKIGSRFKTWKYRYFELWSNGLLNYFDDEVKRKKRGSINIMDEVTGCTLYTVPRGGKQSDKKRLSQSGKGSKGNKDGKEHGFMLKTHDRKWHFVANTKHSRDDWLFLIRTIAISLSLKEFSIEFPFNLLSLQLFAALPLILYFNTHRINTNSFHFTVKSISIRKWRE